MKKLTTGVLVSLSMALPAFADSVAEGEALAKSKCGVCHPVTRAVAGARKVPEAERAAHLDKFLSTHFANDAAQRKAIVDYLMAAAGQ